MTFPTADQVALAIVAAARLHGDDPLSIARGGAGSRGRAIAYCALTEAFPDVTKGRIARFCGYPSQSSASAHLIHARKSKWWSEAAIDEIVGQLVAEEIEPDCSASRDAPPPVAAVAPAGRETVRGVRSDAPTEPPHFELDERRLILRMREGGADAAAIAAALGASPGEVTAWLASQGVRV